MDSDYYSTSFSRIVVITSYSIHYTKLYEWRIRRLEDRCIIVKKLNEDRKIRAKALAFLVSLTILLAVFTSLVQCPVYAHGAVYSISTEGNRISVSLRWDEVNSKKPHIAYYYFSDVV